MHCRIQCSQGPMSSWLTTYNLPTSTYHLKPATYNFKLPPITYQMQGGSGKLNYFFTIQVLESDRPSLSPVELPGTMLSMKFCIEWCRVQGLLKSRDIKILRFWFLGFQGFATYPNFEVLGFQGLATIEILRSWVSRDSLHIKILMSWVSRVLRHIKILRSWVSRVPRKKGRARSKIHQGPRPWTQQTQDLGSFWDLGTSLVPKQCPLIPTENYILVPHLLHLLHALHALVREIIQNTINIYFFIDFHRLFNSDFAPSALRLRRLNSWSHTWHDSDGAGGTAVYLFLRNCLSSELRVGYCQYSRAFLLWALLLLTFSRAARSFEVAPRWYCA